MKRGLPVAIFDFDRAPGKIDEQLLARDVHTTHNDIQVLGLLFIALGETRITNSVRTLLAPTLPQLFQCGVRASHFGMRPIPVGRLFELRDRVVGCPQGGAPGIVIKRLQEVPRHLASLKRLTHRMNAIGRNSRSTANGAARLRTVVKM